MNSVCYDNIPLHRSDFNVHLDNCWHHSRFCVLQLNILGERRAIWYTFYWSAIIWKQQQILPSEGGTILSALLSHELSWLHQYFYNWREIFACASFYNILLLKGAPALLHVRGKEYTLCIGYPLKMHSLQLWFYYHLFTVPFLPSNYEYSVLGYLDFKRKRTVFINESLKHIYVKPIHSSYLMYFYFFVNFCKAFNNEKCHKIFVALW